MMKRFVDSSGLFGEEEGKSTNQDFVCGVCHTQHTSNKHDDGGDYIWYTEFAGMEVCDACWVEIENSVLERMPQIIRWYVEILSSQRLKLSTKERQVRELLELADSLSPNLP